MNEEGRNILITLAKRYNNDFSKMVTAIKNKEHIGKEDLDETARWLKNTSLKAIAITDDNYPEILKNALEPPIVIFYKGSNLLTSKDIMGLAGSKHSIKLDKAPEKFFYLTNNCIATRDGKEIMDLEPKDAPYNDPLLRYKISKRIYLGSSNASEQAKIKLGIGIALHSGADILVEYQKGFNAELIKSGAMPVNAPEDFII